MQPYRCPCVIKSEKITPVTEEPTQIHRSVIEACKKGNIMAQYTLYNQYSKAMFNLAYRMMNSREDAEDVLQDSFSDAFRKLSSFRFESTFGAWLKTIVINSV
jgi:RNA polymerase sigma-70 factor (ECF subfamily)